MCLENNLSGFLVQSLGSLGAWLIGGKKAAGFIFSMAISGTNLLEVPTIYKAHVGWYTSKIWPNIRLSLHFLIFRILEFPLVWIPFGSIGMRIPPVEELASILADGINKTMQVAMGGGVDGCEILSSPVDRW